MRLFVAIEASPSWQREAEAVQRGLPEDLRRASRLVDAANMHVTLCFIGDVHDEAVSRVSAALEEHLPPVEVDLRLAGVRTFGAAARTSSVWFALDGDLATLRALHERANAAVQAAIGVPSEGRPYTPHLTIARVRNRVAARDRRRLEKHVRALHAVPAAPFTARRAILVRSRLGAGGPHYETLASFS